MNTRLVCTILSMIMSLFLLSCGDDSSGDEKLPSLIEEKGHYSISGYSLYFDAAGDYAVISNRDDENNYRIYVMDISDSSTPQLVGSMETGYFTDGIVIDGSTAYIAREEWDEEWQWYTKLQQIDLSDLSVIQTRDLPGFDIYPVSDMALYDGYLYLMAGNGLIVIKADEIETFSYADAIGSNINTRISIDSASQRAYVTGQLNLLDIFDISTASSPSLLDPGSVENPIPLRVHPVILPLETIMLLCHGAETALFCWI